MLLSGGSTMKTLLGRQTRCVAAFLCATFGLASGTAAQGWQPLGDVTKLEKLADGVELTAGAAKVRATAVGDGIFRVRVAASGTFPKDFSWAVIAPPAPPPIVIEDGKSEVRMTAGSAVVIVQKTPLLIRFADLQGNVLLADEPTLPMAWDG